MKLSLNWFKIAYSVIDWFLRVLRPFRWIISVWFEATIFLVGYGESNIRWKWQWYGVLTGKFQRFNSGENTIARRWLRSLYLFHIFLAKILFALIFCNFERQSRVFRMKMTKLWQNVYLDSLKCFLRQFEMSHIIA